MARKTTAENKEVASLGYSEKIDTFLKERLEDRYYAFWQQFTSQFPLPFHKPSSSSGKYHQNASGEVDSLEQHTTDLLMFVDKLARVFGDTKEEQHYPILLLAAALHDITKYGEMNERKHTTKEHDVIVARKIKEKGAEFGLTEYEVDTLSEICRYHSGRWSSWNPGFKPITFTQMQFFIHLADMCSTNRCLKFE